MTTLKVDRSFVMEMHRNDNDAAIVRSTVNLARDLGLEVVAEGVETQAAWSGVSRPCTAILRRVTCSAARSPPKSSHPGSSSGNAGSGNGNGTAPVPGHVLVSD